MAAMRPAVYPPRRNVDAAPYIAASPLYNVDSARRIAPLYCGSADPHCAAMWARRDALRLGLSPVA